MELTVAVVTGAHGLKGHVRLSVRTDHPDLRFRPGVVLDTDNPDLPELTIAEARPAPWRILFAEVSDRTGAEALRGTELRIESDDWEPEDEAWYDHELVGLPAVTPAGTPLGAVAAVEHGPAQDLLVVRTPGGRDVRVPFVAALVPAVTADHVTVDAPAGLFDEADA